MDIEKYKVIITPTAYREINRIYEHLEFELYAKNAAKELMRKFEQKIQQLKEMPSIYPKVEVSSELQRTYRKMSINNYIILYTIEEESKQVFISHMYYKRKNYFDNKFL